jgi:hypothetical protein
MRQDRIDFPRILQDTLREVVRRVLVEVAEDGLPEFDYFYISFRTDHPGVRMSAQLRERYPQEMTVVLQNQFWDLSVDDDSFGVTLQFNTVPQHLTVPFAALTAFVDPPAEFALRFDKLGEDEDVPAAKPAAAPAAPAKAVAGDDAGSGQGASVIRFDPSRRK